MLAIASQDAGRGALQDLRVVEDRSEGGESGAARMAAPAMVAAVSLRVTVVFSKGPLPSVVCRGSPRDAGAGCRASRRGTTWSWRPGRRRQRARAPKAVRKRLVDDPALAELVEGMQVLAGGRADDADQPQRGTAAGGSGPAPGDSVDLGTISRVVRAPATGRCHTRPVAPAAVPRVTRAAATSGA